MTVTFFGHRDAPQNIQFALREILVNLIKHNNADLFYVGNQGGFDFIVRKTLKELQGEFPDIRYYVVLAYMPEQKKEFDLSDYSDTIYPDGLESTPPRFAIAKRNQWMIKQADIVITYVNYIVGGAAKYKELAEKKGKRVININV
ncbi:MAG: hypothetical protein UHH95_01925 [Oscillospiraceae bacterium]|nr:hypothetical protein [Oscillospiraceae bacterium]